MTTRSKASRGSKTRLGIRYFDDCVLLTDTHAWAYYRIPSVSYEFTTGEEREALATNITVALAAIRMPDAEVHLRIAHRSFPAQAWAAGLDATSDDGPGWREYLEQSYQHVWAKDFWTKEIYLGVRLGQRSVRAQLSGGILSQFAAAYGRGERGLGLIDEAVSGAEIARWTESAERLGRALNASALAARHATSGEIAWLIQHTLVQTAGEPLPSATRRRRWGSGEIDTLFEGQIHNGRTVLGLEHMSGTSYAAFVSFARFPDVMSFPDGEPWLHFADSLPFPVEVSSRMKLIPPAKASKDVGRRLAHARDMDAHIREAGAEAPIALAEQIAAARMLEHGITKERLPFVYGWHRLIVTAPTRELCVRRVEAVVEHYRDIGIDVVNSTGDQFSLLSESLPGDRIRLNSYVQRQPLYTIAGGMPTATVGLGDRPDAGAGWIGPYIGETLGRARSIVHFDPLLAAARNRPTAIAITGEPGGGKTTLALLLIHQLALRGATVAVIDPKGDAESLVEYLRRQGRKARVLPLGAAAPGLLDPFSFGVDLAEKRTMATETLRLLLPRMSEERESAMIQAVGAVAGTERPSLSRVIQHLEAAEDPAWKNTGAVMRSISEMRLARLCFAPSVGQQIDAEGWTTVFTLGGLTLPDTTTDRDDYSYEQRLSVALLYLVSQFARKLLNGIDRAKPKAIFLDEAWAITSTPEGAKLVPEVSRMGRSRNTALILVSQNAGDLLAEQVTNCLSSVFAFRSSERGEVANVMSLLGVAPSEEHKAVLRGLGNGECIFRDLDGRAGRIGIDLVSEELRDWIDTNPTRARGQEPGPGTASLTPAPAPAPTPAPPRPPKRRRNRTNQEFPSMVVPFVPSRRRADDRAVSRPGGRRAAGWAVGVLLIAGALLAIASPAWAATNPAAGPQAAQATQAAQTTQAQTAQAQAAHPAQGPRGADRVELASVLVPSVPGGVCQVPGIGDIGGLVGLCSAGSSGIVGDLNNICAPSLPQPEQATGGIDAMVEPPSAAAGGKTLYDNYGVAGQFWAAHGLQCSDMTSLIGNNVAGMVFDAAKSVDRVTITVYQSAAGNNILTWLQDSVDRLITALGNAIYFPYLAPVVILGAMWLAWQGLIRKRATRTIEGTLWMVVAATAAIALIGRPADFTGIGTAVSNGTTQVLNTAFSELPAPAGSDCLPVAAGDPQSVAASYAFTSGNGLVDENANELWSVLVCKPWLYGELGSTAYGPLGSGPQTVVDTYGRQLLWSQAIAANETPTAALIQAKQATYTGIANSLQAGQPGIYPLFQGNQWTTRLEIAFAAMFAALVAGLLILLIALTLIVLKLGFLLLLVAGPFFLIIGTHPGFGRIIAIRWFEMLAGVLLKQVAIAIVLSVLLYCYSLIMGTADAVLPWALKILMIALVTVAVFIYRKPFTHLFSAVGYGTLGSAERAEYSLREAGSTFRRNTVDAATVAVPGMAGVRAARWARRNPGQATAVAAGVAGGAAAAAAAAAGSGEAAAGNGTGTGPAAGDAYAARLRPDAPPAADGDDGASPAASRGVPAAGLARAKNSPETETGAGRTPPPLDLPPRNGPAGTRTAGSGPASAAASWSRGAGRSTAAPGPAPARSRATSGGSPGPRPARPAPPANGTARTGASNGSSARQGAPAWPLSSWSGGSTAAGPRQRPAAGPRPAEHRPAEPPRSPAAGTGAGTGGTEEPRAMPFWLRPIRRK